MSSQQKIVLGLWPLAGVTTVGVSPQDVVSTLDAAVLAGITCFDTAFSYGYQGESDIALGRVIAKQRERFRVFGKVGQRWTSDRKRIVDGTPETLIADAETSLRRMGIERFDVLFLHSPDPNVDVAVSATAIRSLQERGLCDEIGMSNMSLSQFERFRSVADCDAIQCPLNLLQPGSIASLARPCSQQGCDVYCFWTLMKGLLAGAIKRNHAFEKGDSRPGYDIFQGNKRETAHRVIDQLTDLAGKHDCSIAQLAIGWVISQPEVTAALVGARRPEQITETASSQVLSEELLHEIEAIVGPARSSFEP